MLLLDLFWTFFDQHKRLRSNGFVRSNDDRRFEARDGIEPPTPALSGPLPMVLSGLESADAVDCKGFKSVSFWDHLGLSKLFSSLGCSRGIRYCTSTGV